MSKNIQNNINPLKRKKPIYSFNMKRIIKERQAEREKNPAFDEELKKAFILNQAKIKDTDIDKNNKLSSVLPKLKEHTVVEMSMYNIPLNDDLDFTKSCSDRLQIMSIELNEISAKIHFNFLMNADWLPVMKDFEDVLRNWCIDLVAPNSNPPIEHELKDNNKGSNNVGWHNFELVLRLMHYKVLKNPSGLNENDLLTLAKYSVKMYYDPHCRQLSNVIKMLFSVCIETALHNAENTAIKLFAQELYSNHSEEILMEMIVDLFLPNKGPVMETIYSYLSYSLFKKLLGKNDENVVTFPTNINDWFVQELIDKNYFKQSSMRTAYRVIDLLEHVVAVFDLYKNKKKLDDMYGFLYRAIRQNGLTESQVYINKLDQWKLRLCRLHIEHAHFANLRKDQSH